MMKIGSYAERLFMICSKVMFRILARTALCIRLFLHQIILALFTGIIEDLTKLEDTFLCENLDCEILVMSEFHYAGHITASR